MMKRSSLPREINALLAVGDAVAESLAERQDDPDIHREVEALLRAGIAATECASLLNATFIFLVGTEMYLEPGYERHVKTTLSFVKKVRIC
jgi:hypothetical protein